MKINIVRFLILLIVILLLTPLRSIVILITPLFCLFLYRIRKYEVSKTGFLLIFLYIILSIVGLIHGTTLFPNILLSCYIVIPILIIFCAKPLHSYESEQKLNVFIKYSTRILYIVNTFGFICFVAKKMQDEDAFGIPYGGHFNGVHGLAVINAILSFYYLSKVLAREKTRSDLFNCLFFFLSFILCFYGLGLICLFLTLGIYVISRFNFKILFMSILISFIGFFIINKVKKSNIDYIVSNVILFTAETPDALPRKLLMIYKYFDLVKKEPEIALFGTGSGGYNGRLAFLLNNDSDNIYTKIFRNQMPYYHKKDIYPLWNKESASLENYTDGTRNQPFSSLISILSENGLIFGLIFTSLFIKRIKLALKKQNDSTNIFHFLTYVLMLLLLISDMWMESSEFLFFVIIQFLSLKTLIPKSDNNNLLLLVED